MGLETESSNITYLNIKQGKIVYKDKNGEKRIADSVSGFIKKVEFAIEQYEGRDYEKAKITIVDGMDNFILQMRVDSGYFRGFCNSVRSGNPTEKIKIAPSFKETDNKKQSTCFIQQDGHWLKHYFNKDNNGDLPQLKKVMLNNKEHWDGTEQMEYWKNWLISIEFTPAPVSQIQEQTNFAIADNDDDLPF
jgi:hypothetical protein